MPHIHSIKSIVKSFWGKIVVYVPSDIKEASGLKQYIRNTAWLFSEKILRLILGVWIVIWVARFLGPSKFGLLNYAISFVGLFTSLASLGVDTVLIRELTLFQNKKDVLLGSAFFVKLFGSFISIVFVTAACIMVHGSAEIRFLIIIAAFTLLVHPFLIFELYFRSIVRSQFYAWAMMISLLVGLILRIMFILKNLPLPYFAAVPAVELTVVSIMLSAFYIKQNNSILKLRVNFKTAKHLLRDSWPLLFSGAMISIYMRIDQVMIQNMLGDEAVGYYSAAVRISEAWYFLPLVICQSVLPSVVSTRNFNRHLYEERLQRLFNLMVAISFSVAIPMALLSGIIIPMLYGPAYAPATFVFQIHIWSGIFVSIGLAGSNWLLSENLQRFYLFNVFLGALLNVFLNIFFIKYFFIFGAAIATVISYCVSSYLGLSLFKETRPCFKIITRSFMFHKWFSQGL